MIEIWNPVKLEMGACHVSRGSVVSQFNGWPEIITRYRRIRGKAVWSIMFYILHMDPILLCLLILHRLVLQFSIARTSRNIPALAWASAFALRSSWTVTQATFLLYGHLKLSSCSFPLNFHYKPKEKARSLRRYGHLVLLFLTWPWNDQLHWPLSVLTFWTYSQPQGFGSCCSFYFECSPIHCYVCMLCFFVEGTGCVPLEGYPNGGSFLFLLFRVSTTHMYVYTYTVHCTCRTY